MTSTTRRRSLAVLGALALVATAATSSLAVSSTPRSSFNGDFDVLLDTDAGKVLLGHATAQLFEPTNQRLVPGTFDFVGAPDNAIRESHAQIGQVDFWDDPDHWSSDASSPGATVAFAEGVECVYFEPGVTDCHPWAVMFIDNDDPGARNEVAFAISKVADGEHAGQWDFVYWQWVGDGSFVLKYSGE
jgi:hypothetical protein